LAVIHGLSMLLPGVSIPRAYTEPWSFRQPEMHVSA
jgi:hypothetical protein